MTLTGDDIDELIQENAELKKKINEAKNCLVCSAIADPFEVCENTLMILNDESGN